VLAVSEGFGLRHYLTRPYYGVSVSTMTGDIFIPSYHRDKWYRPLLPVMIGFTARIDNPFGTLDFT